MDDLLSSFEIVGLGECTHGNKKNTLFRFELIKTLIQKHKFRCVVLEEDVYGVHQSVHTFQWNWANPIMKKLLDWIVSWNSSHPSDKVTILGVDIQKWQILSDDEKKELKSKKAKVAELYCKYGALNESNAKKGLDKRDFYMFKMFEKQWNSKKTICIFHNGHLSKVQQHKDYVPFGHYLYTSFGNQYFNVANTFVKGKYYGMYMGFFEGKKNEFQTVTIHIKDKVYGDTKGPQFFYPPPTDYCWEGHGAVDKRDPLKYFEKVSTKGYDSILLINNEEPLIPYKDAM
jgi:erythromycin esterase-like protein